MLVRKFAFVAFLRKAEVFSNKICYCFKHLQNTFLMTNQIGGVLRNTVKFVWENFGFSFEEHRSQF